MADLNSQNARSLRAAPWLLALLASCASVPPTLEDAIAALPAGAAELGEDRATRDRLAALRGAIDEGRAESTIAELRSLVSRTPQLVPARLLLARALAERLEAELELGLGDKPRMQSETWVDTVREAEVAARGALQYEDKSAEAWGLLGRIREADGHLEAALEGYQKALEFDERDPRWPLSAARVAVTLGQERTAVRHLERIRRRTATLPSEVLLWEARCYVTLQDSLRREARTDSSRERNRKTYLSRARRAFDELAAREPVEARTVSGQAYCRYAQLLAGDIDKSEKAIRDVRELYLRAARMAPRDPQPRFDLAVLLQSDMIGDESAARAMYESALERDPEHLPSQLNLARLLWLGEDERDRAVEIWRKVLPRLTGREQRMVAQLLAKAEAKAEDG